MVTLMRALWLADPDARERASVKPHASPASYALEYPLAGSTARIVDLNRQSSIASVPGSGRPSGK